MIICDRCIHGNVCGVEGAFEEALNYCRDFLGWIPVSERLPEDHKNVLICLSSDQICIGCYNSHRLPFSNNVIGWGASYVHKWCSNDVIAWMPLPEPYHSEIPTDSEPQESEDELSKEDRAMINDVSLADYVKENYIDKKSKKCKDCKWWKDSDGVYRRGVGAESKCPINNVSVNHGLGYCYMFEPQESEEV